MEMILRSKRVADIPVLELFQNDGNGKKPIVLLFHGYLARKEFILPQAYNLAVNGFFTVVPDAYGHGERSLDRLTDLFTSIINTTADVNRLIDGYQDSSEADAARVGIAGYSMGGCITYHYLVQDDRRVKAAVPVVSTPDWVSIVDGLNSREGVEHLKASGVIQKEEEMLILRQIAEKTQPISRYEKMKDVPLLMLCGENDTVTPAHGAGKLHELLKPVYSDPEALRLAVYPGIAHGDTVEMNFELAAWMNRYIR